jgi:hypothetical protein
MPVSSLRRLALADVDQDVLQRLIAHGEDLLVESERELPDSPKFGATVASFANTIGGWLLLGVDDQKTPVGYDISSRVDLQSHLGHILRNEVDPVPPFVAGTRSFDGAPIGIVRVFESEEVPVIVKQSGAIYIRDAGGKHPVTDHRTILELARRGALARERAQVRLVNQPLVNEALDPPDARGVVNWLAGRPANTVRVVARIAPLTVTPQLSDWPMSRLAAEECAGAASSLVVGQGPGEKLKPVAIEPHGRGVVATAEISRGMLQRGSATVVADSAGVFGAVVTRASKHTTTVILDTLVAEEIRPIIDRLAITLSFAEAYGTALCDLWLLVPGEVTVHRAPRRAPLIHVSGEMVVPADSEEVSALIARWQRELERTVGIGSFEPG